MLRAHTPTRALLPPATAIAMVIALAATGCATAPGNGADQAANAFNLAARVAAPADLHTIDCPEILRRRDAELETQAEAAAKIPGTSAVKAGLGQLPGGGLVGQGLNGTWYDYYAADIQAARLAAEFDRRCPATARPDRDTPAAIAVAVP